MDTHRSDHRARVEAVPGCPNAATDGPDRVGVVAPFDGPACVAVRCHAAVRHIRSRTLGRCRSPKIGMRSLRRCGAGRRSRSRRVAAGGTVDGLPCLEHQFGTRELGRMGTRTGTATTTVTTTATTTSSTAMTPAPRPRPSPPRPRLARVSVARQVKQQRRGYATAVLRTLARTHRGRPAIPDPRHAAQQPGAPGCAPESCQAARARRGHRGRAPRRTAVTGNRPGASTWHTSRHGSR
jgi:hypothetical protein